jgi:predicted aldo/keto reductase-like oxidoreductase
MQFNALYCWSNESVHTLSLGISKPSDLILHAQTLAYYHEAQEHSAPIAERIRAYMNEKLGAAWCATWHQGIPEWDRIPGGVNVKEILRLYNYAKALDMVAFAKMRYNLLGQTDDWFPGNNAASFQDDELKLALSCSPYCDEIPQMLREAHALLFDEPKKRLSES